MIASRVFFSHLLMAAFVSICVPFSHAQQIGGTRPRAYDGWVSAKFESLDSRKRTVSVSGQTQVPERTPGVVQSAFYQSQGSFSDGLPSLPPGNFSTAPAASGGLPSFPSAPPVLPTNSNANQSSQPTLPPNYQSTPTRLPHSPSPQPTGGPTPSSQGGGAGQGGGAVLPPTQQQYQNNSATPSTNTQQLRNVGVPSQPASYQPGAGYQQETRTQQGSELRAIGNSPYLPNGRLDPRQVATGLPYVTPSPSRYPTSPYNHALFQTVAYQRNQSAVPAVTTQRSGGSSGQLVSSQTPAATGVDPRLAAQQASLPQYAQPGIYPTAYQCPTPSIPTTGAVPGTYVPPTYPPNLTPGLYSANNSGYRPFFSLGQENYNVTLGRGIIGQPTVYVPRQPIRNFLRYLFP